SFCSNLILKLIAVISTLALILLPMLSTQIIILLIAAAIGAIWPLLKLSDLSQQTSSEQGKVNWVALSLFALLLGVSFIPIGQEFA
ncbi:hypothetical protein R0K30_22345, partial [Bacillus sp. SIMBA_154]|uniref:hypothetical protein n=1 Tax=Bacillus sp. SIMBA_154 TaxID=3080859 RepID=UPI00397D5A50